MAKAALVLATIVLLIVSVGLTSTHSDAMVFNRSHTASLSLAGGERIANANSAGLLVAPNRTEGTVSAGPVQDAPAPALVVYLVLILVGSAVGVGFVRHTYRREV